MRQKRHGPQLRKLQAVLSLWHSRKAKSGCLTTLDFVPTQEGYNIVLVFVTLYVTLTKFRSTVFIGISVNERCRNIYTVDI